MAKKYFFQEVSNVHEYGGLGIMDEDRDQALELLEESIEAIRDSGIIVSELAATVNLFHHECIGLRRRNDELEIEAICYRMARNVHASEWRK